MWKKYNNPPPTQWPELIERPSLSAEDLGHLIDEVFDEVRQHGDEALLKYTARYDRVTLNDVKVSQEEIDESIQSIDPALVESIDFAYNNIRTFHLSQQLSTKRIETTDGVTCWQESRGIDRVGLYIPGGSAPLFSTVLMLAIPASIAGCRYKVLCSPPGQDGRMHPVVVYTAHLCGITEMYKVGGAQAIAAMVYGTESIASVYKIYGPGNQYVTAAKLKAQSCAVAIDIPAGPSEVLVYADDSADARYVASDLLSQAEHGIDSQVVLVTHSSAFVDHVQREVDRQLATLPRRDMAIQSIANGRAIVFEQEDDAFDYINLYAPEHLIIASDRADQLISLIGNAGSVFLGHLTPESAGDYASGTNHTLPTAGYARAYSGVSLDSFVKKITFQKITPRGLKNLGPHVIRMAEAEHLTAHGRAIGIRLEDLANENV